MILTGQPLINCAGDLMRQHHAGQFRADGVTPYHTHPDDVAMRFAESTYGRSLAYAEDPDYYRGIALSRTHDVAEDTDVTLALLSDWGMESIIPELKLLTKFESDSYLVYLLRLKASGNTLALTVKLCDMDSNLADLHRIPSKERQKSMRTKYELARHILTT